MGRDTRYHSALRSVATLSLVVSAAVAQTGGVQWFLHITARSWEDARVTCVANDQELVSITSAEKNAELNEWLLSELVDDQEPTSVWIGGRDFLQNGFFDWSDGSGAIGATRFTVDPYQHWNFGEPSGEEYCVEYHVDGNDGPNCSAYYCNAGWNDAGCGNPRMFVCEAPPPPFFVFHTEKMNWHDARRECFQDSRDLASVHSAAENAALEALITERMNGGAFNVYIGGHDLLSEANNQPMGFQWSDGTRWDYTGWIPDGGTHPQPDADGDDEDCVEFRSFEGDVGWADTECTAELYFVCGPKHDLWTISEANVLRNWAAARAACRDDGNHLANIMFEEEDEYVLQLIQNSGVTNNEGFWIGANDLRREGSWRWSDLGVKFSQDDTAVGDFYEDLPNINELTNNDCATFTLIGWRGSTCNNVHRHICRVQYGERPMYLVNNEALLSGSEADQSLDQAEASDLCSDDNRDLASIHSEEDNALIVALAQQFVPSDARLWIGGQRTLIDDTSFEWIDGTEFTYTNWNSGEPSGNLQESQEQCMYMRLEALGLGEWGDTSCEEPEVFTFVCGPSNAEIVNPWPAIPTPMPTSMPTAMPSSMPAPMPTSMPTPIPTSMPTYIPTPPPTPMPTVMPTYMPTVMPTYMPTSMPSSNITSDIPTIAPDIDNSSTTPPREAAESFVEKIFNEDRDLILTMVAATLVILCAYFGSRYMETSVKRVSKKQLRNAGANTPITSPVVISVHARSQHEERTGMETLNMLKKSGNHYHILLAGLALVDFITDWFFVFERFQGVDAAGVPLLSTLSAVFLGIPMLGNAAFIVIFLYIEFGSEEVSEWYFENSSIATVVAIIALGNPDVLILFISLSFGCLEPGSVFNAPFSDRGRELLYVAGVIANVFEDLPQIGIQLAVIAKDGASPLTMIALATSGATLFFGIVRRFFLCIMFCRRREARLVSRERSVAASEAAAASRVGGSLATELAIFQQQRPQMFPLHTVPTTFESSENEVQEPKALARVIPVDTLLAEQAPTVVTPSPLPAYLQSQTKVSDIMQYEMKVANASDAETVPHAGVTSEEDSVHTTRGAPQLEMEDAIYSQAAETSEEKTPSENDDEIEKCEA